MFQRRYAKNKSPLNRYNKKKKKVVAAARRPTNSQCSEEWRHFSDQKICCPLTSMRPACLSRHNLQQCLQFRPRTLLYMLARKEALRFELTLPRCRQPCLIREKWRVYPARNGRATTTRRSIENRPEDDLLSGVLWKGAFPL